MKRPISIFLLLASFVILLSACGTAKHSTRKCDGKKGTRTPMGLM